MEINPIKKVLDFIEYAVWEGVITKGSRILSQGCEMGTWEEAIFESGYLQNLPEVEVIGADIDLDFLRIAKKIETCVASDVRALSFKSASFDLSYSPLVLQWLSPEDRCKNLNETARILRKGGKAMFLVPGPSHLKQELSYLARFSGISRKEIQRKKSKFFLTLKELRSCLPKDFSIELMWQEKESFLPSPEQRVALVYADTLAPNIPHNREAYCKFLRSLTQQTSIHWVVMICQKRYKGIQMRLF